ncbi:MAG: PepSY domain-containing protein [Clostridia bacterium]|nr:PepSY domain-containing protein [Clostridia bacterium]
MKTSEKELNLRIKKAYEAATPDVLESVLPCCNNQKGRVIPMEKKSRSRKTRFIALAAAAAALLLVFAGTMGVLASNARRGGEVYTTVSLDVNPSIEISINKQEKVLAVKALNDDAAKVVGNMDLVDSGIDVAVNALIGSMLRNGYLSEIANSILITVGNTDAEKAMELQRRLVDEIEAALAATGGGAVISQTADTREDMESLANRYGITAGKAQLIYSIIAAAPRYTFEQLAGLSINELNLLYTKYGRLNPEDGRINEGLPSENAYIDKERAIEIALDHAGVKETEVATPIVCELDFDHGRMVYEIEFIAKGMEYDLDIDAVTGEVIDFEIEPVDGGTNPIDPAPSSGSESYIGEAEAKCIAFERASVSESEVTGCIVKLEHDHGRMVYDIEFKARGNEYDVDVDAITGEVLEFDMDPIGYQPNPGTTSAPAVTPTSVPNYIGEEAASRIAFERAQVDAQNVYALSIRLEHDHGRMVYDVEFRANGFEYDIDVDAINGNVLEFDMDLIVTPAPRPTNAPGTSPNPNPNPNPTPTQAPGYIGEAAAKSIAFGRAGISPSEATYVKVELKRENGRMVYDVEFKARGYEYDVDIDAITGAVLEFDMEVDDDAPGYTNAPRPTSTPRPTNQPQQPTPQPTYIGEAAAKSIAFNRAGISASEARNVEVELERENGRMIYDVEFDARGNEYEVKVDAINGNVLYYNCEADDDAQPQPTNPPLGGNLISEAQAKTIAFQRAGVTESQVRDLEIDLDEDDGIMVYEIEFEANGREYSVEINAVTGAIIDFDVD